MRRSKNGNMRSGHCDISDTHCSNAISGPDAVYTHRVRVYGCTLSIGADPFSSGCAMLQWVRVSQPREDAVSLLALAITIRIDFGRYLASLSANGRGSTAILHTRKRKRRGREPDRRQRGVGSYDSVSTDAPRWSTPCPQPRTA